MVAAASSGTSPEIPGQIVGYWLAPWSDVPAHRPDYRPTGAFLVRRGETSRVDVICLDLVSVAYRWVPLSEAGRYTYSHSEGLLRGERWRFVLWEGERPTVYEASYEELLDPVEVASLYGDEAGRRCRPDRPAVQLRLRIAPTSS